MSTEPETVTAPRWERPAFLCLLLGTAVLYLWGLGASGYANSFYSAAAQAGGESWKAFLFGASDAAGAITVDKPAAALWPMGLSVRLFGLGAWQILVPQALMGVGTVAVLYRAVRRRSGPAGGLLAGALTALTPVAALMFRFNNPDALLCLLMVSAVAFVLRALENAETKWLLFAGVCFGFGFLAKTLQAWLILPAVAVLYLVCAPAPPLRRVGQLLLGGLAAVASCGWWVALVELWPADDRPYIGGSQTNSFLELTLGYNGLGRITGEEKGSVGPGSGPGGGHGGGPGFGENGIGRLFSDSVSGQISWLLPAALVLLLAGLVLTCRAARTDTARAAFLVWGGALLMTAATFSLMSGIFHEYYTVALAPYAAAVAGMGAVALWRSRRHVAARATLALTVVLTAGWAYVLLQRTGDSWFPWLRWAVVAAGAVAACGLLLLGRTSRRAGAAIAALGLAASLAGPLAYTLSTISTPHTGSIVTAGPSVAGGPGGQGGPDGGPGGKPGKAGPPGMPSGGAAPKLPGGGRPQESGRGGTGGLLNGSHVGREAEALLEKDADDYTWVAAAIGSQNSAGYQLATEKPVMAIGGFNGSDPSPTSAQFRKKVADGEIHYFVGGAQGGPGGGRGSSAAISEWVQKHFTEVEAGNSTLYDLTDPK